MTKAGENYYAICPRLVDYFQSFAGIYAVYQDQQLMQAKTRKFIDFLAAEM